MGYLIRTIDTETTGLDPAVHRVCEIAYVDLHIDDEGNATPGDRWSQLLDPGMPIPPSASGVHHITDDMVKGCPTLEAIMPVLKRDPQPDGYCSHVRNFDMGFVKIENVPWLCTYKIALWLWPDAENHKAQTLRYELGLKIANETAPVHRAMGDAVVSAAILRRAIVRKGASLDQMIEVSSNPAFLPRLGFGPHAMEPIAAVPRGFLEWMLNKSKGESTSFGEDAIFTAFNELQRRRDAGIRT